MKKLILIFTILLTTGCATKLIKHTVIPDHSGYAKTEDVNRLDKKVDGMERKIMRDVMDYLDDYLPSK